MSVLSDHIAHLEEFRRRLIVCIAIFAAASVGAYFFSHEILEFLIQPLRAHGDVQLFFTRPYEAFLTHLKVAALAGFLMSVPVIFTQLWHFVAPGLYKHEKRIAGRLIIFSVLLFAVGCVFAYKVVIPWGLFFLLSFQTESLRPLLGIGPYFSFLIGMIIAFGILFDFPVILIGLVRLGIVKTKTVASMRKIIIVLIFIAAAVLTPSPDPISQLLLATPLLVLFEASLWIARIMEKRQDTHRLSKD